MTALLPLPQDEVTLTAEGWLGDWQSRAVSVTLRHVLGHVESGEAAANLARLVGLSDAPHRGMVFTDSDVYKTLEAVAWACAGPAARAGTPGPDGVVARAERLVGLLEQVQEPDGYLNSWVQGTPEVARWSDARQGHELYCAGHLFQAAVAASVAGVLPGLTPIATRFADLLVRELADSDHIDGHPQVETALVELYRLTGVEDYLDLARRQLAGRGLGRLRAGAAVSYFQDGVPVDRAREAVGHAVRQIYLLTGAVDVAVETGDSELLAAAVRVWDDLESRKTYLTGAHGSRHRDEAIGDAYELPPDRAYAETCAAIGAFQLAWRLLLATGEARFADAMDNLLHNAIAGAVSAEGDLYFYSNPLQLRTGHDGSDEDAPSGRLPWYTCACCPPNLARLLASIHSYLLTRTEDGLQLHHPTAARVLSDVGGVPVQLTVASRYPYLGEVEVTVETDAEQEWELALRVPGWCHGHRASVDGAPVADSFDGSYLRLRRSWRGRHVVRLVLDLPVRVLAAHPRVDAVRGCVALARGPLLYALEQADLPEGVVLEDVRLVGVNGVAGPWPRASEDAAPDLVLDVDPGPRRTVALRLQVAVEDAAAVPLYRELTRPDALPSVAPAPPVAVSAPFEVTALPYHLWANRTPGAMRVWLPLAAPATPDLLHPHPPVRPPADPDTVTHRPREEAP